MDVLSPQLMWIGKRCYRINPTLETEKQVGKSDYKSEYLEDDLYDDDDDQDDYIIEVTDGNRFRSSFHVPNLFYAQLIGAKGMTRRRIESETKAQIKVPKPGVEGDIVVIGPTRKSVVSARRRIEIIVLAARNKQQFTHFLSVPCKIDEIKKSYTQFRDEILAGPAVYGLDSSLFQNPNKLHLTLGTLSLMDNEDRATAAQLLQDCQETVIKPILREAADNKIFVEMRGIEYMNDDPGAVDVLYGRVNSEPLQRIANGIVNYFIQKGLIQAKYDHVKMHVTLINSLFRQEERIGDDEKKSTTDRRMTFDARDILKKFEGFYFGKLELKEIHLSQRYSTACDGFYEATGIIKL